MPEPTHRTQIKVKAERAVLAAVRLPGSRYDPSDPFGELRSLAEQAGAVPVGEIEQLRDRPDPATYMGSGKVTELRDLCERLDAGTIIFDHELSPAQIGKIERQTERKVLDRSELILDIFASRATTHQARLQVELAQLEYTYPRLRAMWDHLERVVGGSPTGVGTRGPGEQQLEIDRRLVQRRKQRLTRELAAIHTRKRREVGARTARHFTVGLVGYTNAGKSTLFNTLTAGGAYADDRLFATLMTRTRAWHLGGGLEVMLSDTVGFVRDLPHHLVASFRATLEETLHADLLLIVLDVSSPGVDLRYETVRRTLDEILSERNTASDRIVLLNKTDLLDDPREILMWQQRVPDAIPICALDPARDGTGEGLDKLAARVRLAALGPVAERVLTVPLADAKTIDTLEKRCEIVEREYTPSQATIRVRIGARLLDDLIASGARISVVE